MVYSEKFVAVVVCNGKILQETRKDGEDVVKLPFNSEYSIKLKNLNSVRALVSVEIDGQDVLDNKQIIINANDDFELKGFLKGYSATNAFRFIKKTKEISDYRGDKIDDGFIRITCQFEKQPEVITKTIVHENHHYTDRWYDWPRRWDWPYNRPTYYNTTIGSSANSNTYGCDDIKMSKSVGKTSNIRGSSVGSSADYTKSAAPQASFKMEQEEKTCSNSILRDYMDSDLCAKEKTEDGITVKGERVNQDFKYGSVGALEEAKQVIIIRLKGTDQKEREIVRPVFVRSKKTCNVCGKRSESNVRFCAGCGTNIEDIN